MLQVRSYKAPEVQPGFLQRKRLTLQSEIFPYRYTITDKVRTIDRNALLFTQLNKRRAFIDAFW